MEKPATSLHDDVCLVSEERHERVPHSGSAHLDSVVGVVACARCVEMATKASGWFGMPLTGGMGELRALCGSLCSTWKDFDYRAGESKER